MGGKSSKFFRIKFNYFYNKVLYVCISIKYSDKKKIKKLIIFLAQARKIYIFAVRLRGIRSEKIDERKGFKKHFKKNVCRFKKVYIFAAPK